MFKRIFSFILTVMILISSNVNLFNVYGEEEQVVSVRIPILSNVIPDKYLTGYLFDDGYFISIDDICRLTRSTYEISDNEITIKQGIRSIFLDIENNTINFSPDGTNVDCKIEKYNGTYLLKPYSMLKLLFAYCDYIANTFIIKMPESTIMEAIDFDLYNNVHYHIGSEKLSTFITLAGSSMFMDLLSKGTGAISFAFTKGTDEYMENSLYEIAKVNICNYSDVKEFSNNLINERVYIAEELLKITDSTRKAFEYILKDENILNKLSDKIEKLNNSGEFVSIIKSAEELINNDLNSYLLLKGTLTHENLDNLDMNPYIIDRAEYVSKVMESRLSAYCNVGADKIKEKLFNDCIEEIFKNIDKIHGTDMFSFLMAYDIGTSVTKILMNDTFEAYKSNLNAIYLSEMQNDTIKVANQIYELNRKEFFSNPDNIKRLIDIYSLYDRITIAMYENLKKADDEFKMFDKDFLNQFDDFCNKSAENAYKLSLCNPEDTVCSLKQFSDYYKNDIFDKSNITDNNSTTTTVETPIYEGDIIDSGNCGADGDNVKWELYENGTLRIYGTGDIKNYNYCGTPWYYRRTIINNAIIENGITSIGSETFGDCEKIMSITIPNNVTSIGEKAFRLCRSLTSLTIPNSVTSIGSEAFYKCDNLKSIKLPNSITKIYWGTFSGCENLESIIIPDSVTIIEIDAFYLCYNLKAITLPHSITKIGDKAFWSCHLEDVYYTGTEEQWNAISIISPDYGNYNLTNATIHYNSIS
ncbi:MAG: leucine-rich repeat domain-containing protein [Ruminococcus flavefaciens]|nr:leucine-rich repeat domain-containing protein [Ruminococcus flavefaciens]MCM1229434.1 leucine-rich repeat domain-containing protein [Ruminococcus flavefaciens]